MILTRRKISQTKTLKNGVWNVEIGSITESISNNNNMLIFNFKHKDGQISLSMPVDSKSHSLLCDLMTYCDIKEYKGLNQFIGGKVTIEIINNNLKNISK